MKPEYQDRDLIDILWRQDIDLGVVREDFDYNYRQKEYALEKQKKLEKEKQEQLQKEQEKALLAQLQLDEETGEFVAIRPAKNSEPANTEGLTESIQIPRTAEQDNEALSFDECMQLLAEAFPFVEDIETVPLEATVPLEPSVPIPAQTSSQQMAPHETQQAETSVLPSAAPESNSLEDLEQTWQELLSIPELQWLHMQNEHFGGTAGFSSRSKASEIQSDGYIATLPSDQMVTESNHSFLSLFDRPYQEIMPPESQDMIQLKTNASDNANSSFSNNFNGLFCSTFVNTQRNSNLSPLTTMTDSLTGILDDPLLEQITISDLAMNENFDCKQPPNFPEVPDSDSGLGSSPNTASPHNSMGSSICGDAPYSHGDSDMDDLESSPDSVKPEFPEMYPMQYQNEDQYQTPSLQDLTKPSPCLNLDTRQTPKDELPVSPGHRKAPFTKDKHSKRVEARLTRDEQRAKALKVPFSVRKIINLPVDDFNEMVSKYQLNEPQLALIRDIRRRGKNKVAAQNCRKRKLENLVGLEQDLDSLEDEKEKLLEEKGEHNKSLHIIKQQLNSLYREVFSMLRDGDGHPYSPSEYSLQHTSDGSVFLVPRSKKLEIKRE
ncbi:nuclear factor erythroid 2-related factor 2a isoform X2 [Callorhinchus milii]|uniref:Nfe2 like bZIP transcription factor 2a n=1 Tax=Callorhinchus milii TaxID=7868 RepID=A0A4W3IIC2_CALMI|nr:nuclear factor erythroid 2-related factor 2a isoform X2 [Callorhinchus milii]|eukprot:gi/632945825/ref/XP_007888254.1/ PREDICTED: nuclear factor erythroid 2-related factor 2 isoform X2 [Callorhinchus milii]